MLPPATSVQTARPAATRAGRSGTGNLEAREACGRVWSPRPAMARGGDFTWQIELIRGILAVSRQSRPGVGALVDGCWSAYRRKAGRTCFPKDPQ
jgi:hypothetical protein